MGRLILTILLGIGLLSCNPFLSKDARSDLKEARQIERCNRKLDRLVKKCPILQVEDTISHTEITGTDTMTVTDTIYANKDVSGVDSLVNRLQWELDSLRQSGDTDPGQVINRFREGVKNYVLNRPVLNDTTILDTAFTVDIGNSQLSVDIVLRIFPVGTDIGHQFQISNQAQEITVEVPHKKVETKQLSWYQQFLLGMGNWWKWVILIIIVGAVVYVFKRLLGL